MYLPANQLVIPFVLADRLITSLPARLAIPSTSKYVLASLEKTSKCRPPWVHHLTGGLSPCEQKAANSLRSQRRDL
jgi:hypothetical protein